MVRNKEHDERDDHLQHGGGEPREADGGGNARRRQVGSIGRLELSFDS